MDALGARVLDEIAERHAFFARWFNGTAGDGELDASLARFDPSFRRVDTQGREADLPALAAALASRRGTHAAEPVSIAVEDARVLWQGAGAVLAAYVEAQPNGTLVRRRSTALFVTRPDGTPLWRHVQETALTSHGEAPP